MANEFDPYREALVQETATVWPDEFDDVEPENRVSIAQQLHAEPEAAADLEYVRLHSGFARQITVTTADIERVGS
jgi:hypothetical protein